MITRRHLKNIRWYFLITLLIGIVFIWYAVVKEDRGNWLTVAFLDVGQGDAIFIEAPNGNQVLIDGGPDRQVLRELSKLMPFYDRSLDLVIATHPDLDHIGGLPAAIENYKVSRVVISSVISRSAVYQAIENLIKDKNIEKIPGLRGIEIVLDSRRGARLRILLPDREPGEWNENDFSVVTQLIYGENEFLLTGDISQSVENYLTYLEGDKLESNILKVSHHGSKTSTSELFVGKVSPEYSIISAGKDNRYGHPHKETVEILEKYGTKIVSTYENGTIIFKTNGEKLYLK